MEISVLFLGLNLSMGNDIRAGRGLDGIFGKISCKRKEIRVRIIIRLNSIVCVRISGVTYSDIFASAFVTHKSVCLTEFMVQHRFYLTQMIVDEPFRDAIIDIHIYNVFLVFISLQSKKSVLYSTYYYSSQTCFQTNIKGKIAFGTFEPGWALLQGAKVINNIYIFYFFSSVIIFSFFVRC